MKLKHLQVLVVLTILFSTPSAHAADKLNQLYFDKRSTDNTNNIVEIKDNTKLIAPKREQIEEELVDLLLQEYDEDAGRNGSAVGRGSIDDSTNKKSSLSTRTRLNSPAVEDDLPLLLPSTSGPRVDDADFSSITSAITWKKRSSCKFPAGFNPSCDKSRALNEIVERFTGDKDYAQSLCQQECKEVDQVAILSALSVKSTYGGSFSFVENADGCHYQLKKPKDDAWRALSASKVECSCVPKVCAEL